MSKKPFPQSTQDKYYKIVSEEDKTTRPKNEIKVTLKTRGIAAYVRYALHMFLKENEESIIIKSAGNAANKGVTLAEVLRHRIPDLHQINRIAYNEIKEVWMPKEEGLDEVVDVKTIPVFEIKLTTKPTNQETKEPGYQKPLPSELVEKANLEDLTRKGNKKEKVTKSEAQSEKGERNGKQSNRKKSQVYEGKPKRSNSTKRGKSVSRYPENGQRYYEGEEDFKSYPKSSRRGNQDFYDRNRDLDYDRGQYYQDRRGSRKYNDYEEDRDYYQGRNDGRGRGTSQRRRPSYHKGNYYEDDRDFRKPRGQGNFRGEDRYDNDYNRGYNGKRKDNFRKEEDDYYEERDFRKGQRPRGSNFRAGPGFRNGGRGYGGSRY